MRPPVAIVVLVAACSGSPAPPATPAQPLPSIVAPAAQGDVQVATVEGRPVWGSCVTAQAARGLSREAALDQCIAFELMAIEAEKRGLARDADVLLATKTALVSQLVAHEYEDKFTTPESFGTFWSRSLERNRARFDHPEARGSVYVRVEIAKDDPQAKQLIDEIHAALANERGLMKPHLEAIAQRVAGMRKIKIATVPPDLRNGRLDQAYAAALFAVPEIGRVSPPVRTPWGWDVVLWDSVVPEVHATQEEQIAAALPEIKRGYFPHWVNKIAQGLGIKPQLYDKNFQLLESL